MICIGSIFGEHLEGSKVKSIPSFWHSSRQYALFVWARHLRSHWNALQTCAGWGATFSFPFLPTAGTHRLLLVISAQTDKNIYPRVASLDITHPPAFFFIQPHPSFLYQLPWAGLRGESFWGCVRNCINYSCLVLWPQGQRCQSRLGLQQWCIVEIHKKKKKRKTSSAGSLGPAPAQLY